MYLLKRIVKIFMLLSIFFIFIPITKEIKLNNKIDNIIISKQKENKDNIYKGYLYIPKFKYKNIIKKDNSALDDNYIEMTNFSDDINGNNIVLAGHNNKYVFNKIYYLRKGDELIIDSYNNKYKYIVDEYKYINVDDYNSLIKNNSLILITCTNDNQERYIVIAKKA